MTRAEAPTATGAPPAPVPATWDLPGQPRAAAILAGAVARGEVSHAWAFLGPAGVGQQQAARTLAAALNCPVAATPAAAPCGRCDVCRRCLNGSFPALHDLAPTGASHRVDEVRDHWLHTASRSAAEGRWKVLHVRDADRMNEAAANAFLKGLEEPPPGTVWVLDVADPDELPDTILSRCRVVRFAPWGSAALAAEAEQLGLADADDRALAVRLAMGSPAALQRLAAPGVLDDVRERRRVLRRLREEGPAVALLAAKAVEEEAKRRTAALKAEGKAELAELTAVSGDAVPRALAKQVEERTTRREREARVATVQAAIDDLVAWCRDALVVARGGDAAGLLHVDAVEDLRADADALGPQDLLRTIDLLLRAREDVELNVQPVLALEAVFLEVSAFTLGRVR